MTNNSATLKFDTPENVSFDYYVAGVGSRFLAALIDTLAILFLQVVILGTLLWLVLRSTSSESLLGTNLGYWMLGIVALLSFLFMWGYYIFFEIMWNGQTLGKRWIGLRVIRLDGTPVTVAEVVIRNLVRITTSATVTGVPSRRMTRRPIQRLPRVCPFHMISKKI